MVYRMKGQEMALFPLYYYVTYVLRMYKYRQLSKYT